MHRFDFEAIFHVLSQTYLLTDTSVRWMSPEVGTLLGPFEHFMDLHCAASISSRMADSKLILCFCEKILNVRISDGIALMGCDESCSVDG